MFCKHCGAKLSDNTRFCHNCGSPTEEAATPTPYIDEPTYEPQVQGVNTLCCPECGSRNLQYLSVTKSWICKQCENRFYSKEKILSAIKSTESNRKLVNTFTKIGLVASIICCIISFIVVFYMICMGIDIDTSLSLIFIYPVFSLAVCFIFLYLNKSFDRKFSIIIEKQKNELAEMERKMSRFQ